MTDEGAPKPTGWLATMPPEAQRELMQRMLAIHQYTQVMNDAGEVGALEMHNADALDAEAFVDAMRSSAATARRQAQVLEAHAGEYDAIAELVARWT